MNHDCWITAPVCQPDLVWGVLCSYTALSTAWWLLSKWRHHIYPMQLNCIVSFTVIICDICQRGYVFIGIWLLVSRITHKTALPIFTKFSGKAARGPRKKPADFCGNPDHMTSQLRQQLGYGCTALYYIQIYNAPYTVRWRTSHIFCHWVPYVLHLLNSDTFAGLQLHGRVWFWGSLN